MNSASRGSPDERQQQAQRHNLVQVCRRLGWQGFRCTRVQELTKESEDERCQDLRGFVLGWDRETCHQILGWSIARDSSSNREVKGCNKLFVGRRDTGLTEHSRVRFQHHLLQEEIQCCTKDLTLV